MSYSLEVDPRAERDLEEAIDYYERARVGLGSGFFEVLRATFERVVTAPEACAPVPRSKAARFALVDFGRACLQPVGFECGLLRVNSESFAPVVLRATLFGAGSRRSGHPARR